MTAADQIPLGELPHLIASLQGRVDDLEATVAELRSEREIPEYRRVSVGEWLKLYPICGRTTFWEFVGHHREALLEQEIIRQRRPGCRILIDPEGMIQYWERYHYRDEEES